MSRSFVAGIATALGVLGFAAGTAHAAISSGFDAGAEGWTVSADPAGGWPAWQSSGGNPGGFMRTVDAGAGQTMYWEAPAGFEGNQCAAYGGALEFDLRQSTTTNPYNDVEIILTGGGVTLQNEQSHPTTSWTEYSIPFTTAGGWTRGGASATDEDLKTVLASVTRLAIRAEYQTGSDTDDLDNPAIVDTTSPGVCGSGVLAPTAKAPANDFALTYVTTAPGGTIRFAEQGSAKEITGTVVCASIEDNRARIIYEDTNGTPGGTVGGTITVEDNGATGDRLANGRLAKRGFNTIVAAGCPVPATVGGRVIQSGNIAVTGGSIATT
jgi:hypothetical protein